MEMDVHGEKDWKNKQTDDSKTRIPEIQRLAEKSVSGNEKKRKLRTEKKF